MNEYSRNPLRNARELFNFRHSSLCNAIERAVGVLKKHFPIISSSNELYYWVKTVNYIIFVCCILYNYLQEDDPNDELLTEVDEELLNILLRNEVHIILGIVMRKQEEEKLLEIT